VVISAVLIVLFSALFALVRSSARSPGPADKTAMPDALLSPLAAQGRALFESRCASCHGLQEGARPLVNAADESVARGRLLTFLEGHGHSSATENPAIVEFLAYAAQAGTSLPAANRPPVVLSLPDPRVMCYGMPLTLQRDQSGKTC
jgi:mono/diheme cytochrome c family protein